MFIIKNRIRKLARTHGKLVTEKYIAYLEQRIETIILTHIKLLGPRIKLSDKVAKELDAYRMTEL